jgi:GGDEF domain-containing protein
MRLKDILALPLKTESIPTIKQYLEQSLDNAQMFAAFSHYLKILLKMEAWDIIIVETQTLLELHPLNEYQEIADDILQNLIKAFILKDQLMLAEEKLEFRKSWLPELQKYRMYEQKVDLLFASNKSITNYILTHLEDAMPKEVKISLLKRLIESLIDEEKSEEALLHLATLKTVSKQKYFHYEAKILKNLKDYDSLATLMKQALKEVIDPHYIYYYMEALIQLKDDHQIINLDAEHEMFMDQSHFDQKENYYEILIQYYRNINNQISYKLYEDKLRKLRKYQDKVKKENESTNQNYTFELKTTKLSSSVQTIEMIHAILNYATKVSLNLTFRDYMRQYMMYVTTLIPSHTILCYETLNSTLYYFKKDRFYDRKMKLPELEQTLFSNSSQHVGFIEANTLKKYSEILSKKPYDDTIKLVFKYKFEDAVWLWYFEDTLTSDDVILTALHMMDYQRRVFQQQSQLSLIKKQYEWLLDHPSLAIKMVKQGQVYFNKKAQEMLSVRKEMHMSDWLLEIDHASLNTYQESQKRILSFQSDFELLNMTVSEQHLFEHMKAYPLDQEIVMISVIENVTLIDEAVQSSASYYMTDPLTHLKNIQAFHEQLPSYLNSKVTLIKLEIPLEIEFLYGVKAYQEYFKELAQKTKKILQDADIFMLDGHHLIIVLPYNDVRAVTKTLKQYYSDLKHYTPISIQHEPFQVSLGVLRYPIATTETHLDTLMYYLDIALKKSYFEHDEKMAFFQYHDYEVEVFEQHVLDQMFLAFENNQFDIRLHQIIDQEANKVLMYESEAFMPHLAVEAKDIIKIAKKRHHIKIFDMHHIERVLNALKLLYQSSKRYVKMMIPVDKETFLDGDFVTTLSTWMKTYQIPKEVLYFNIHADLKANIHVQVFADLKALGIGLHTSSLKTSIYYEVEGLHFDVKTPSDKVTSYLEHIHHWANASQMTFILRNVQTKELKHWLYEHHLMFIEGTIYKQITVETLIQKLRPQLTH